MGTAALSGPRLEAAVEGGVANGRGLRAWPAAWRVKRGGEEIPAVDLRACEVRCAFQNCACHWRHAHNASLAIQQGTMST